MLCMIGHMGSAACLMGMRQRRRRLALSSRSSVRYIIVHPVLKYEVIKASAAWCLWLGREDPCAWLDGACMTMQPASAALFGRQGIGEAVQAHGCPAAHVQLQARRVQMAVEQERGSVQHELAACRGAWSASARSAGGQSPRGRTTAACASAACCAWTTTAPGSTTAWAMPTTRPSCCSCCVSACPHSQLGRPCLAGQPSSQLPVMDCPPLQGQQQAAHQTAHSTHRAQQPAHSRQADKRRSQKPPTPCSQPPLCCGRPFTQQALTARLQKENGFQYLFS